MIISGSCHHLIHHPDGNIQHLHFLSSCLKERKQALPSHKQHIYICLVAIIHKPLGIPSSGSLSYNASSLDCLQRIAKEVLYFFCYTGKQIDSPVFRRAFKPILAFRLAFFSLKQQIWEWCSLLCGGVRFWKEQCVKCEVSWFLTLVLKTQTLQLCLYLILVPTVIF